MGDTSPGVSTPWRLFKVSSEELLSGTPVSVALDTDTSSISEEERSSVWDSSISS